MMPVSELGALIDDVAALARAAGAAILEIYGGDIAVDLKEDRSPLTDADRVSHSIIRRGLLEIGGRWPLLSEESASTELATRRRWTRYWLVDPLDGTKEFLKHNGEFTVNIALVDARRAVLGVVYAPALRRLYCGVVGIGAWRIDPGGHRAPIRVRERTATPVRVVGSRSHPSGELGAYLQALGPHELVPMGSSLKICLVAEGAADLYPRLGPTSEWDTAAAQAILESAGGRMMDRAGQPLRYNAKDDLLNPHFLAFGDPGYDWLMPIRTTRGRKSRN